MLTILSEMMFNDTSSLRVHYSIDQCNSAIFHVLVGLVTFCSICSICLNGLLIALIRGTKGISRDLKKLMVSGAVAAVLACCQQFMKAAWYLGVALTNSYEQKCLCMVIDLPFLVAYGAFAYLSFSLIANRVIVMWRLKQAKTRNGSTWTTQSIVVAVLVPIMYAVPTYTLIITLQSEHELHSELILWCAMSATAKTESGQSWVILGTCVFAIFVLGSVLLYEKLLHWNQKKINEFKMAGIQQNLETRVVLKETQRMAKAFKWTSRCSFGGWTVIFIFAFLLRPLLSHDSRIFYFGAIQHLILVICLTLHPILMVYFCVPLLNTFRKRFKIGNPVPHHPPHQPMPLSVSYIVTASNVLISQAAANDHVNNLRNEWQRAWLLKQKMKH